VSVSSISPQTKWQKRRAAGWPFLLAGTLTFCSGFPAAVPEVEWISVDKIGHFAAYGALATAIIRNPALARLPGLGLWWALVLASGYGLGDEFRQSLTVYRQYDLADWAADTVGAVVAVTLYLRWPWYHRLLELPVRFKRAKPKAPEVTTNAH
jgi:VanZ family protein